MQRLTEWTGEEWIPVQERVNGKIIGNKTCLKKLAAYEDIGLEPEEVAQLLARSNGVSGRAMGCHCRTWQQP